MTFAHNWKFLWASESLWEKQKKNDQNNADNIFQINVAAYGNNHNLNSFGFYENVTFIH